VPNNRNCYNKQMERLKLKVAVYIILIKDGMVLMGRRFNTGWQDGNYGLPAGHLEYNESVIEALLREVKEESNLDIKSQDVKFVHTMHRKDQYIDLFFTTDSWTGEPMAMEKDKCDDMQWFPINNLPVNTIPSVKFVIENFQKGILFSEFQGNE